MPVLLPLLCMTVYALLAVRVTVHVQASFNDVQSALAVSLRAFGLCLRVDDTLVREGLRVHARRRYPCEDSGQPWRPRWNGKNAWWMRAAVRSVHWGAVDLYLRLGTDEAWCTALLAGALRSCAAAFSAVVGRHVPCDVRVDADFHEPGALLTAQCIFSAAPGDIMIAVVKEAVKKTQREGFKWLSIPSRA